MAKTYVLAGYDHNGVFDESLKTLSERDDVVIIHAKPGQSVAQAIAAQPIGKGDHVIIAAHGSETGKIEWNKGEPLVPYSNVFDSLPKGVATIAVTSCYGEMALKDLQHAPDGAMVVSLVGNESVGRGFSISQFSKELSASSNTVDIVLNALDNVDPQQIADLAAQDKAGTADPDRVLPHTVGIGGHPPVPLDLNGTLQNMMEAGKNHTLSAGTMGQAALMVAQHFDTTKGRLDGGFTDEVKLKAEILNVAAKIQAGTPLEGIEEKRIGYALAISYIDKSGELQHMIDKANGTQQAPAKSMAVQTPVPEVAHTPTVEDVQKFLNAVGVPGADGQPLVVDGQVGNNTLTAFHTFCNEHGLNPRDGAGPEFQKMMESFNKGTLTKGELNVIQQFDAEIDVMNKSLSPELQKAIRAEFADVRAAMMGSNNDHDVKAQIGELVATVQNAVAQQTGKGAAR